MTKIAGKTMTTKEMIRKLKECDTQYGWTLSWKYASAIIKTLQDYDDLRLRLQDVKFPVLGKIR